MYNGKLITFCGLDGCGKTTMIKMLENKLNSLGINSVITKQPTNEVRKSEIFRTFMDKEDNTKYDYRALSLFAASDRIQHCNKVILPLLKNDRFVISDRYFYSNIANLRARGYKEDNWIYEVYTHVPKPDIAFFLDIDIDTGLKRIRSRENEKNKWIDMELYNNLKKEYIYLAKKYSGIIIDSNGDANLTFKKIWTEIEKIL